MVFNCIALGFWFGGLLGEKAQIYQVAGGDWCGPFGGDLLAVDEICRGPLWRIDRCNHRHGGVALV